MAHGYLSWGQENWDGVGHNAVPGLSEGPASSELLAFKAVFPKAWKLESASL